MSMGHVNTKVALPSRGLGYGGLRCGLEELGHLTQPGPTLCFRTPWPYIVQKKNVIEKLRKSTRCGRGGVGETLYMVSNHMTMQSVCWDCRRCFGGEGGSRLDPHFHHERWAQPQHTLTPLGQRAWPVWLCHGLWARPLTHEPLANPKLPPNPKLCTLTALLALTLL